MKSNFPYRAFNRFVLRTPLLSFRFYEDLTSGNEVSDSSLQTAFVDSMVREAIFLASPTLFFELEKWVNGNLEDKKQEKVKLSFLKYLSRMCSRCTPFGLFAGCSVGYFGEKTSLNLKEPREYRRFTRPDMNYLVALSQDLAKKNHIKKQLTYFPNSSLYTVGNQLRYVEYFYIESRRQHNIVEVDNSTYLQKVLHRAGAGASLEELANELIEDDITANDAFDFLDELLDSQVLTSSLEPSVSGPPFVNQLLNVLKPLEGCQDEIQFLKNISKKFELFDAQLGNDPKQYINLSTSLKEQPTTFELKFLFQTDLEPTSHDCQLSKHHLLQIKRALELFNRTTPPLAENNLSRFKDAFLERYEEREMPLAHVLDVETGIGYLRNTGSGDVNPLVDNLMIPETENHFKNQNIDLNKVHRVLLEKLLEDRNAHSIKLSTTDFQELPSNWDDLPNTLSTMVEFIKQNDEVKIKISGSGGSSAANMLGRFCHDKSDITSVTKEIIAKEKKMEPEKILAEIVHLSEARVGNILMRPHFREYEIPYLAQSIVPNEKKLPLEDLYVSVRGNRVYLRSKKENREVLPRLTNAHNYSANSLPIYHFLADLQTQGFRGGINFNFGPLNSMFDFLPRVEFENLILSEARWRIKEEEILGLTKGKSQREKLMGIQKLRDEKKIPQYVLLSEGDNELLVNLKNTTSVLMLLDAVKNRDEFLLKEFLHHQDGLVLSKQGYHTNQVVVSFFNERKVDSKTKN